MPHSELKHCCLRDDGIRLAATVGTAGGLSAAQPVVEQKRRDGFSVLDATVVNHRQRFVIGNHQGLDLFTRFGRRLATR